MIIEATAADHAALAAGQAPRALAMPDTPIAPPAVLEMLGELATRVRTSFSPASWLIVEEHEVVGLCSVTRVPDAGVIEIGYGIAPSRQRRGHAAKAIGEVVAWARLTNQIDAIIADTARDNLPSQRVLAANGFNPSYA